LELLTKNVGGRIWEGRVSRKANVKLGGNRSRKRMVSKVPSKSTGGEKNPWKIIEEERGVLS